MKIGTLAHVGIPRRMWELLKAVTGREFSRARSLVAREAAPLKGTTYHRKVPKTDADHVRVALAAERRAERAERRLVNAVRSHNGNRILTAKKMPVWLPPHMAHLTLRMGLAGDA